ncbi:beta-lactamase regulating signal transducer with metallopeptidase domain [Gillisia mitskevichiae]|uniref:Beta-lactamase regulating signal transducer with metallopeptidase domain n=1 Tax=Gillisia mitskevichiae TaxID=270921 RepID=A0A495PXK4_9FLAO|nr:M56 family metallopeptidase [Gillisia mitskevichiae]RKS55121.1 beta-lactamase regulating signal transducer with metallopeptidase domain [Gillisia mitskevichiae]
METYLLNSAACLAILLLFYKLLLEKETMHLFKRFYLLGSLFAAILIPYITFTSYVEVSPTSIIPISEGSLMVSESISSSSFNWTALLWIIYGLGVVIFSIKFFRNLAALFVRIKQNPKLKNKGFINVLLNDNIVPHTFFSYLFFNKDKFNKNQIPQEVIVHEEAHAKQLHSLDILFVEILQIVFWFNPLIYLAKNAIQLNHEFLADQSVIKNGIETSIYQRTLLAFSSNAQSSKLANAFNYSSIKKRFTVMKTHTSKRTIWSKGLLLLPLLAVLLFSFSTSEVIERDASFANSENLKPHYKNSLIQDIATKKMVKEYNALAKKYNSLPKEKRTISRNELERMVFIFDRMNKEQRDNSEKFPEIIVPKNAPAPPMPIPADDLHGVVPPPPPPNAATPAPQVEIEMFEMDGDSELLPPPPPPVPSVHMKELAEQGAIFYFEGKEITGKEAIKITRESKSINIQVRDIKSKKPIVKLSKDPIVVEDR